MRSLAVLITAFLACISTPVMAHDVTAADHAITVSAVADARSAPDKVEVSVGLSERATKLEDARAKVDAQLKSLRAIAKDMGIAEKDLKTTYSAVHPQYRHVENNRRVFEGYQVTHNITVTLRDLDKLAGFTDRVLKAGIDEIHNTQFGLEDPETLVQQALKKAVTKARNRAQALADATGTQLGGVLSIREGTSAQSNPPVPFHGRAMAMESMSANGASAPPGGEISGQSTVTIIYELAK